MTTGHVFIATSLDGNVARLDHRIDWLTRQPATDEDLGYERFLATVDGIVMGRGSFENVLTFGAWPYTLPVVVASRSLAPADLPGELRGKVEVSALAPEALLAELDARGWRRAYVDGGLLVQDFLRRGLIEDLVITVVPTLIGEGRRLFGALDHDVDLELVSSQAFANGMVQSTYRVLPVGEGGGGGGL